MSDPFVRDSKTSSSSIETKVGLAVVSIFSIIVVFCGWLKYKQQHNAIPLHIQNAPIAKHVGPDFYLSPLEKLSGPPALTRENSSVTSAQPQLVQSTTQTPTHLPTYTRAPNEKKTPAQFAKDSAAAKPLQIKNNLLIESNHRIKQPSRDLSDDYLPNIKVAKSSEPTNVFSAKSNVLAAKVNELKQAVEKVLPPQPIQQTNHQTESEPAKSETAIRQADFRSDKTNDFTPGPRVANSTADDTNLIPKNELTTSNDFAPATPSNEQDAPHNLRPTTLPTGDETNPEELHLNVVDHVQGTPVRSLIATDQKPENDGKDRVKQNHYTAKPGDSFWTIAQTHYDDGRYFKALFKLNENRVDDFEKIGVGKKIEIPTVDELQKRFPNLCPSTEIAQSQGVTDDSTYQTKKGDTLFDIARRLTGQASNYLELIRLNQEQLPDDVTHLTPLPSGVSLRLPQR